VSNATNQTESNNHPTCKVHCAGLFIIGTDTEVGKTYVGCQIARMLVRRGIRVGVYKPVLSGLDLATQSDAELLKRAAGLDCPEQVICPQQFQASVAPPLAARLEGKRVDDELLVLGANWWLGKCDLLLVEGAGGGLSPISDRQTVLDLAIQFGYPLLIVAADRLGAVNHTLLTLEAAEKRRLTVAGVVLNPMSNIPRLPDPGNLELIRRFAPQANCFQLEELTHFVETLFQ
jgi:dethiobiotin synthetase